MTRKAGGVFNRSFSTRTVRLHYRGSVAPGEVARLFARSASVFDEADRKWKPAGVLMPGGELIPHAHLQRLRVETPHPHLFLTNVVLEEGELVRDTGADRIGLIQPSTEGLTSFLFATGGGLSLPGALTATPGRRVVLELRAEGTAELPAALFVDAAVATSGPALTTEERARREASDESLRSELRRLTRELEREEIDPRRSGDPRAQALRDVDEVLRTRRNHERAVAVLASPAWKAPRRRALTLRTMAVDLVAAHQAHQAHAGGALLEVVVGNSREPIRPNVADTFNEWHDRMEVLEVALDGCAEDEGDEVLAALRRLMEERRVPYPSATAGDRRSETAARLRMALHVAAWRGLAEALLRAPAGARVVE